MTRTTGAFGNDGPASRARRVGHRGAVPIVPKAVVFATPTTRRLLELDRPFFWSCRGIDTSSRRWLPPHELSGMNRAWLPIAFAHEAINGQLQRNATLIHAALFPSLQYPGHATVELVFGLIVPLIGVVLAIVVFARRRVAANASAPVSVLAIVALILGVLVPIGGVICGHIALTQIRGSGQRGRGLAFAGVLIGYVAIYYALFLAVTFAVSFSYHH